MCDSRQPLNGADSEDSMVSGGPDPAKWPEPADFDPFWNEPGESPKVSDEWKEEA